MSTCVSMWQVTVTCSYTQILFWLSHRLFYTEKILRNYMLKFKTYLIVMNINHNRYVCWFKTIIMFMLCDCCKMNNDNNKVLKIREEQWYKERKKGHQYVLFQQMYHFYLLLNIYWYKSMFVRVTKKIHWLHSIKWSIMIVFNQKKKKEEIKVILMNRLLSK